MEWNGMEWDDGETMMMMTMMTMMIYRRFDVADQILVVSSLRWLCGDLLVSHRKAYTHTISNDHTTHTTRSFDDPSMAIRWPFARTPRRRGVARCVTAAGGGWRNRRSLYLVITCCVRSGSVHHYE